MSSTYSTNLGTNLMATGDQSGTWGNTTNFNLGTLMEQAIASYVTQQFSSADVTLTLVNGSDAGGNTTPGTIYTAGTVAVPISARNMYIECQGTSSGNNLIVPTNTKLYFIYNNISSGGGAITVKTASGTGVAVPNGQRAVLVCNGTNVVSATSYFATLASPSVAITGGAIDGTTVGATTASTVRGTTITATTQFTGPGTGLTGTAASLSIGGNAATVTNGVYTSGSYSNPTWITSISGSIVSGTVASATSAASATTASGLSGTPSITVSAITGNSLAVGSPTGGNLGAGTINAQAIYVNNVAVGTGSGSVTSVGMTVPAFLSVSPASITSSGTFAVTLSGTALPVANGGTGGTTQAAAQSALGVPSTTGSGASGTWTISVSGNAGTVTNGVYTSGSYSNPVWLTSISGSIVSGAVASATTSASCSGNAATVTNGVYTTGSYSNPSWITSISGSIVSGAVASATSASSATSATSATTASTANALNTGNSYTVSGMTYNSAGVFPHYGSSSYTSGIITVQSGGSPTGGAAGDIFLIY